MHIIIDRDWVESGNTSEVVDIFDRLRVSRELTFAKKNKVELSFQGYDTDQRELFEIPEVVSFSKKLSQQIPLFFYCNHSSHLCGLKSIALCYADAQLIQGVTTQVVFDKLSLAKFLAIQHELLMCPKNASSPPQPI